MSGNSTFNGALALGAVDRSWVDSSWIKGKWEIVGDDRMPYATQEEGSAEEGFEEALKRATVMTKDLKSTRVTTKHPKYRNH